jgi:hypothetical protein
MANRSPKSLPVSTLDSLLRALEEGILLRQPRRGKKGTTREESILLAVMGLDREVIERLHSENRHKHSA